MINPALPNDKAASYVPARLVQRGKSERKKFLTDFPCNPSREELAREAKVSRWTIVRLETDNPKLPNVSEPAKRSVLLALYEAGIEFTENDGVRRRQNR